MYREEYFLQNASMNEQRTTVRSIVLKEEEQPTSIINSVPENAHMKEGDKYFVFNQTGNILISTTKAPNEDIDEGTRRVFNEVSVFFAALTKSIATTPNPDDGYKPYSIYNMEMLERVIAGSGCFIEMTKEQVQYETSSVGVEFSSTLLSALIGLPGNGAMAFANSLLVGIAKEGCRMAAQQDESSSQVGSIIFVCEMLMGMPLVSAITLSVDAASAKKAFEASPCLKMESVQSKLNIKKETYLFVTPTFIRQYAEDLNSLIGNEEYGEFISYLQALIRGSVFISGLFESGKSETTSVLLVKKKYRIEGAGLGSTTENELVLGESAPPISNWNDQIIEFTIPEGTKEGKYTLYIRNQETKEILVRLHVSVETETKES